MNPVVPLIMAVALFMENMDSTVISTALPAIAADLNVGPITLKLALTTYMVALAIFIPVSGWMADRFGAKRVFRAAILVFLLGSVFCAFSGNLVEFVLSRFLQGMGGAMMTPVGRLVILRTTDRSQLVRAMALLTIPALVGPMAGPPLGGFITTYFTWHWIFLINVPIGIIGYVMSGIFLPVIKDEPPANLDWMGFFLVATAASGIVFGLSVVSLPALPPATGIVTTAIGIAAALWYLHHAKRRENPLLNLKLFRTETFRYAISASIFFRMATGAFPFLMPLMLQLGFGLNPFESGMITFVGAIGALATKFMAPRVYTAFGFRRVLISASLGAAALTVTFVFFEATTPHLIIIAILFVTGLCRSFFFTGVNALGYADIETRQASQATATTSMFQQVSLALGVAFAATILELTGWITGGSLTVQHFHIAFLVVAGISIVSIIPLLRLKPDAGAAVSGHMQPTPTVVQERSEPAE
ncbi:DHA2 family efflux MFS transporter permease subunit [Martelella endophytica]|uniref:Major facilitator transporter n=1 Tax=Martelella endophytica TaxID=1486262 RepID=A0A0D5LVA9_MAREN|nr:DHA2 family efflux MFS transporter permease subunit [Martelella endophytica]AJY47865.1 major facilitator transporter [Martelella endophytica]